MKRLALLAILAAFSTTVTADQYVNGYTRSDGTYVQGYYRSSPNSVKYDNYSSQGNSNPYTGNKGYGQHEYSTSPQYNYGGGTLTQPNMYNTGPAR